MKGAFVIVSCQGKEMADKKKKTTVLGLECSESVMFSETRPKEALAAPKQELEKRDTNILSLSFRTHGTTRNEQ